MSRRVQVVLEESVAAELERRAVSSGRKLASLCAWELTKVAGSTFTGTEPSAVAVPLSDIPGLKRGSEIVAPARPPENVDPKTGVLDDDGLLPWLAKLDRRAVPKDFEDPNFDPEDYQ